MSTDNSEQFDPFEKEKQLQAESKTWDLSDAKEADDGDIPIIDLSDYFATGSEESLKVVADQLRTACEEVGFFSIVGHGVSSELMDTTFEQVREFHRISPEAKEAILMDRPDWPVGGMGYLPVKNRKLPARDRGNLNEAFIVKCDHNLGMDDNQWPTEANLPNFRTSVENYAEALEQLSRRLLPIVATALEVPTTFFDEAFVSPLYRLRMTHYPPLKAQDTDEFGIAPHVDTSFITILAQDKPGLSVFNERVQQWINVPLIKDAFIINTGELLKQWTNDRFISAKHFANNNIGNDSRYSIPFFLNSNSDYKMECVPSCCGPDNPAKYPPLSYNESQGVVQGE